MGNIYIFVFLVNSESVLILAFVKYMLYSHFTQSSTFLYFLEAKNPCFVTKNFFKISYICVFILSEKQHTSIYKIFHNSGMVRHRRLPKPSLNRIFIALLISVQYTLSFHWTNFGLKDLIKLKGLFINKLAFSIQTKVIWFNYAKKFVHSAALMCSL